MEGWGQNETISGPRDKLGRPDWIQRIKVTANISMAIRNKPGQQSKSLVWRNWQAAALEWPLCVQSEFKENVQNEGDLDKSTNARVCSCTLAWPGNIAKKKKKVTWCKILIICGRVYGRGHVFPILNLQLLPISACVRDRWGYLF